MMIYNTFHKNRIPLLIAFLQWYFTTIFQVDRLFFTYESESQVFILIKILYLILLLILWIFLFNAFKKVKSGDKKYRRGLYIFFVYLVIVMLLLFILWPGTWSWDDAWQLNRERYYGWTAWQNILTGIYQEVLLQILPFPGGIILLQNVGISLCVAFIITKLEYSFNIPQIANRQVDIILKLLPFLTPPVLMYQFSGYRMGVYVYIELTMLVMWLCMTKDEQEWTWKYIILFCLLCAITATWRTESLFYIPFVCLGIFFSKKEILPNTKKMICVILIICIYMGINHVQDVELGDSSYKLVSILKPCAELVRYADPKTDKELLDDLSTALDLEIIYNNPELDGPSLYWSYDLVKPEHTKADYRTCLTAFVKLCLKYPHVVIHERISTFIASTGITGIATTNMRTYKFYDSNPDNTSAEAVKSAGWIANMPVFPTVRKKVIYLLNLRNEDHSYGMYRVVWNSIIPLFILLYAWCKSVQKRKWHFCYLMTAVLIKVLLVFLTEPAVWFMYLLSFYFLGYVTLIYGLIYYRGNNRVVSETV